MPAAMAVTLYDHQGLEVDPDDHDDIIDGGLELISFASDPARWSIDGT